ncbi:MAG TPA: hypothetical protein VK727_08775 [Steroidobacteraceae bacterium]|nr:hypothetical protein [Steroidobacteraceae bacterium]
MRDYALQVATWTFSWLAPRSQREAVLGDLLEEYALRANAASASAARRWYLRQLCASALPLLWTRLTRSAWISTLGVALCAYLTVGVVELIVNWALASSAAAGTAAYNPLGMFITFPMVVLIGYFAARFRRAAPIVLGAIMLLNVTAMTLWATESLPGWYRIAYFLVGPAALLIGRALNSARPAR